jgi:hypothetical protein
MREVKENARGAADLHGREVLVAIDMKHADRVDLVSGLLPDA